MIEVWKVIPSAAGYEVSNLGGVRTVFGKVLSPAKTSSGYRRVKLNGDFRLLHSIVLEAFVGPRVGRQVCRHLDGVPANNALSNLKWGSFKENYDDRVLHGTDNTGQRNGRSRLPMETVITIKTSALRVRDIARLYGLSTGTVCDIRSGRRWASV